MDSYSPHLQGTVLKVSHILVKRVISGFRSVEIYISTLESLLYSFFPLLLLPQFPFLHLRFLE